MKYNFEHKNYGDFNIFEDKKLTPRAYFIPFGNMQKLNGTNYLDERYNSDKVSILSGDWDFCYYEKISKMPSVIESDNIEFDKITVPSCWQFTGHEEPYYVNQRYIFDPKPPRIPMDIPVGVYRKKFNLTKVTDQEIITFLGVSPNLELYVNGKYAGYSEGSHNTAEFDITKLLAAGDNEIVCLVYKYCTGTYLEAQDMFRNNGIFRDVYITHCDKSMLYDLHIETSYNGENYTVNFHTNARGVASDVRITTLFEDKVIKIIETKSDCISSFTIDEPMEWSAEIPNLYTVIVELIEDGKTVECIRDNFGLKHIEINGNVFSFNNKYIKIKGINHHDTDETKGFAMSVDDMLRDVKIFKEYNANSVRTSHYPPDPIFIKLCSHYGLYVIDEADIETHGMNEINRINGLSNNLAWKNHYWDRVKRMYERDKNNACITMWSLGNEAGGIACQDYCYSQLKSLTSIPIHYEGACRSPRHSYDVVSYMYYGVEGCQRIAAKKTEAKRYLKPFFLCEYAHAMGVGPGDLDKYMEIFLSADHMLGGCIWEFCDHAVKHRADDKYKYEYTYGGDHGEKKHDGNFCVDGLFFPDRTPNSGAIEMKNVYRPIRAVQIGKTQFQLTNTRYFKDSADIAITYSLLSNGEIVNTCNLNNIVIEPQSSAIIEIDTEKYCSSDLFIIFNYTDRQSGTVIAQEQCVVCEVMPYLEKIKYDNVCKFAENDKVGCKFDNGSIVFDSKSGRLLSYNKNGVEIVNQTPCRQDGLNGYIPTVYRAAIDNYMYVDKKWRKQGLDKIEITATEVNCDNSKITVNYNLNTNGKTIIKSAVEYKVYNDGTVDVEIEFENKKLFKSYDLPKLGANIELKDEYDIVNYYGMGSEENYSDFHKQAVMGKYSSKVSDMFVNYIKPQDNGNHIGIRESEFINDNGQGLKITAKKKPLNISVNNYTLENLRDAKHREDLIPCKMTSLNIDGFVRGIGSNSCGQDTRNIFRHILKPHKKFEYKFRMQIINKDSK